MPELTEEGAALLAQAKVDPRDLLMKQLDDFKMHGSPPRPKKSVQPPSPHLFTSTPNIGTKESPKMFKKQERTQE
eukprot:CAMPEP_0170509754 /NCGR_PEP_ID=MMETSP0208-20121228/65390_1 /TAXON_ID=197538 /ORGANISM="Strombidium inclinatum, Strain S3" /LENGTH=74 /DNA_ID=CAMNT_0010793147 /DNA_START=87 /DNA_END=311 /DNA_ORIENTATION=+